MIYKTFQKVSNVCQLLDKSKLPNTQTVNGITYTVDKVNGTITANGTATAESDYKADIALNNAESYTNGGGTKIPSRLLFLGCPIGGSQTTYGLYNNWVSSGVVDTGNGGITDTTSDKYYEYYRFNLRITIKQGYTANNLIFKPQIFDLTEMYGAGHEPTTVEEFRTDFPEETYDYSPHCFVKSYKDCLKVSDVCQLMDKRNFPATQTINGVTFTNNGDGTITANGTASAEARLDLVSHSGETLLFSGLDVYSRLIYSGCPDGGSNSTYGIQNPWVTSYFTDNGNGGITNTTKTKYDGYYRFGYAIVIRQGYTANNLVFKPMCINLTEMYGAGHEPTTVEQFRADFPDELYDYKPYSIVPSYKKSLICKTKNLFDINSVTDIKHVNTDRILPHTLWSIKNNSLITKVNYYDIGACIFLPTLNLEPGAYTLSAYCVSNHPRCFVGIRDFNKSKWFHEAYNTNTQIEYKFEITEKSEIGLMLQGLDSNLIVTFSNIQLELGSTATEYHPYGYL